MPKSDTWPGNVTVESLSNMDSAGSYDSVISVNSGFSEDSMEHLSADERACLMYLEETIESLEVEDDSGLSNDEPDSRQPEVKVSQSSTVNQIIADAELHPCHVEVTSNTDVGLIPPPSDFMDEPGPPAIPEDGARLPVTTGTPGKRRLTRIDIEELRQRASTKRTPKSSPATPDTTSKSAGAVDGPTSSPVTQDPKKSVDAVGGPTSSPVTQDPKKSVDEVGGPKSSPVTQDPKKSVDEVGGPKSSPVTQDTSNFVDMADGPKAPASPSAETPPNHYPEPPEPRNPPSVAPKPKKIPTNILIKSHMTSGARSDSDAGHAVSSCTGDRMQADSERVHKEALIKLGLLKGEEANSRPAPNPSLISKSRGVPPTSVSAAAALSSTPSSAPCPAPVPSSIVASAPPTGTFMASSAIGDSQILPAPADFSDCVEPPTSNTEWSSVCLGISEPSVNVKTQSSTPSNTPHTAPKHLTPPKVIGIKSATLERSGMGLSSSMPSKETSKVCQGASVDHSLGQLRNSRPRPASLGSGQEFSGVQAKGLHPGQPTFKEPNNRKSFPASTVPQATGDSHKTPRSHGISVLISPHAKNGEDRRQALKKLGLIRD